MQKWIYKWKVHFQYLLSLGLLSANERPPNALDDACRLLFKKKIFIQSEMRTVHETSLFSLLLLFLFSFITFLRCMSLICDIHLRHVLSITHTNSTLCLCILEMYVWKLIFVIRLFLLHSCKKKANESTNFGGKRLGNLLWRH